MKLKEKLLLAFLIFLGSGIWWSTMARSGYLYSFGLGFWGPNGHDGVWHLALMQQTVRHLPPRNPVFAGTMLQNYHWGFDFLAGWTAKLLSLSFLDVYFRLFPLFLAISIGLLSFYLGKIITKDYWVGFWFAFLNYFAGSLGWVVTLLRNGTLGGESLFWSMQSVSTLINPPYALSLVFLLAGFILWYCWYRHLTWIKLFLLGVMFGSLVIIKAYASVLFFLTIGTLVLFASVRKRWQEAKIFLKILIASGIFTFSILLFESQKGSWPFIWQPFWFVRTLFEARDRLYWPKLGMMWWTLRVRWWTSEKLWLLVLGGSILFLLGNFNTRILGALRRVNEGWDYVFGVLVFWGIFIPLFFVQKGTAWNTIQFFYYALFFANLFLANYLTKLTRKRHFLLALLILLPLLPGNLGTIKIYLGFPPPAMLSTREIEGLKFLAKQPEGVVLTFPYNKFAQNGLRPPLPLYLYESTSYVAAFTGQPVFLEDEMNLDITGYPWQERKTQVKQFFQSRDAIWARGFLINNKISYIYLVGGQKFPLPPGDLGVKMIFNNGQVKIYQVMR